MFNPGQYPMMSYPQMQEPDYGMSYARGGSVSMGLSGIADLIRSFGAGNDGILAHINPEEAQELSGENGYDINPFTGLPQFGLFDRQQEAAFGQQFGNGVGLSNYLMGQPNQRMGFGSPTPQQPYNFGNMGTGMAQNNTNSALGRARSSMYGNSSGMGSYGVPRMNQPMGALQMGYSSQMNQAPMNPRYSFNMR